MKWRLLLLLLLPTIAPSVLALERIEEICAGGLVKNTEKVATPKHFRIDFSVKNRRSINVQVNFPQQIDGFELYSHNVLVMPNEIDEYHAPIRDVGDRREVSFETSKRDIRGTRVKISFGKGGPACREHWHHYVLDLSDALSVEMRQLRKSHRWSN